MALSENKAQFLAPQNPMVYDNVPPLILNQKDDVGGYPMFRHSHVFKDHGHELHPSLSRDPT